MNHFIAQINRGVTVFRKNSSLVLVEGCCSFTSQLRTTR